MGMTPEKKAAMIAEARRLCALPHREADRQLRNGAPGPVYSPPGTEVPTEPAPATIGTVGMHPARAALYRKPYAERYELPGGAVVYLHPLSSRARGDILAAATAEALAACPPPRETTPAEVQVYQQRLQMQAQWRSNVLQTIACVRETEEPTSPLVFSMADRTALEENEGWGEITAAIAARCDLLANGKTEAHLYREAAASFFGSMGSWLGILCSQWNEDLPPSLTTILKDCANFVSSLKQLPPLSPEHLKRLAEWLDTNPPLLPEPEPEAADGAEPESELAEPEPILV